MAKDFTNKTFQKILRGYAPEEVDEYIAYINEEYRKIEKSKNDSDRKLALALTKLDELNSKFDIDFSEKLKKAEEQAAKIIADAEAQAGKISRDAKSKLAEEAKLAAIESAENAGRIIDEANEEAARIKARSDKMYSASSDMYNEVCSFRDSLFELYNAHIESVEDIAKRAGKYIDNIDSCYAPDEVTEDISLEEVETDLINEDSKEPTEEEFADVSGEGEDVEDIPDDGSEELFDELIDEFFDEASDETSEDAHGGDKNISFDEQISSRLAQLLAEPEADDEEADGSEEFSDGDETLRIDWKNRRAETTDDFEEDDFDEETQDEDLAADVTRVLNLGGIRQAPAGSTTFIDIADYADEEDFKELPSDEYADEDFEELPAEDEEYSDDFDDFNDFEEEKHGFGNIDALFTKETKNIEMSLTDEFDIVFSNSESKKNVDEIRRQPMVAPEEPKKKKKHTKF